MRQLEASSANLSTRPGKGSAKRPRNQHVTPHTSSPLVVMETCWQMVYQHHPYCNTIATRGHPVASDFSPWVPVVWWYPFRCLVYRIMLSEVVVVLGIDASRSVHWNPSPSRQWKEQGRPASRPSTIRNLESRVARHGRLRHALSSLQTEAIFITYPQSRATHPRNIPFRKRNKSIAHCPRPVARTKKSCLDSVSPVKNTPNQNTLRFPALFPSRRRR